MVDTARKMLQLTKLLTGLERTVNKFAREGERELLTGIKESYKRTAFASSAYLALQREAKPTLA